MIPQRIETMRKNSRQELWRRLHAQLIRQRPESGSLRRSARWLAVLCSVALLLVISALDLVTATALNVSVFYVVPVALAAWLLDGWTAAAVAVGCGVVWTVIEYTVAPERAALLSMPWMIGLRSWLFLVFVIAIYRVRKNLDWQTGLAQRDPLTGLMNHPRLMELANREWARAKRYRQPLTVAYLDVDNFKSINDQWGHREGDLVLRRLADLLCESLRATDLIARVGGDEFVLVMPQTDAKQAVASLKRLQQHLQAHLEARGRMVTVSMGAVTFTTNFPSIQKTISHADRLMYRVKSNGKARIRHEVV